MLFMPVGGTPTPASTVSIDTAYADDTELQFGDGTDVQIRWDTGQTNDALLVGVSGSNVIMVCEVDDMGTDFAVANQTNPFLAVHSADAAVAADYIALFHNQTQGVISTGAGDLVVNPVTSVFAPLTDNGCALGSTTFNWSDLFLYDGAVINWNAGDVTLTHSLNALTLSGGNFNVGNANRLTFDTDVDTYFHNNATDDQLDLVVGTTDICRWTTAGMQLTTDDSSIIFGAGSDAEIQWNTSQTNDSLMMGLSGSNNFIICEQGDLTTDFGHAASTNPRLIVHSADQTNTSDYWEVYHDQANVIQNTGHSTHRMVFRAGNNEAFNFNSSEMAVNVDIRLQTNWLQWTEMTAPSNGPANTCTVFAEDNGAGKTRLMAIFNTGAAQQIAIEP